MPDTTAPQTLARKLVAEHIDAPEVPEAGEPVWLRIDQTLTQDATGTLVMLTLEEMNLDHAETELSVQYIDHNLIQEDYRNPDDHLFLMSAAQRFGLICARPGSGVSHPLHMRYFGRPGATLLGSDSHTCAAGSLGMLAIGTGGLDVAMAIAGEPYRIAMPEIWGVRLTGELAAGVSAKDAILELLRRHGVRGARGRIIEFHGPGVAALSAMDRHVIANMGQEMGHITTVFPSDDETRRFLASEGRENQWRALSADAGAIYDAEEELDLSALEPLIARPSSPGNVVPVREVAGEPIAQAYVGSSANPGYRDFAVVAEMVKGRVVPPEVSLDINPATRDQVADLGSTGHLFDLMAAGARLHQAGCNGCIGMGQAPATGRNSLRTVPRNFPGRSGTPEDSVWLCSPETAAASALAGAIADPRDAMEGVGPTAPPKPTRSQGSFERPPPVEEAREVRLVKGPNISAFPTIEAPDESLDAPVLLVAGDDISTDEILPAGAEVLPYRSNIPAIAGFCFRDVDPKYVERAKALSGDTGHVIVGGWNYGQGSSREHAALAPRHLDLRAVLARSFARIHRRNLINYGVVPLTFVDEEGPDTLARDSRLRIPGLGEAIREGGRVDAEVDRGERVHLELALSEEEREILAAGGLVNHWRARQRDREDVTA